MSILSFNTLHFNPSNEAEIVSATIRPSTKKTTTTTLVVHETSATTSATTSSLIDPIRLPHPLTPSGGDIDRKITPIAILEPTLLK